MLPLSHGRGLGSNFCVTTPHADGSAERRPTGGSQLRVEG